MHDQDVNRRIAEEICEKFAWNNQKFHEGEFVALLDGKIVAVARNPDDAIAVLRNIDSNPLSGMVIEVAHPVVDVIRGVR